MSKRYYAIIAIDVPEDTDYNPDQVTQVANAVLESGVEGPMVPEDWAFELDATVNDTTSYTINGVRKPARRGH